VATKSTTESFLVAQEWKKNLKISKKRTQDLWGKSDSHQH
jgi:hypothetical protein